MVLVYEVNRLWRTVHDGRSVGYIHTGAAKVHPRPGRVRSAFVRRSRQWLDGMPTRRLDPLGQAQ